MCVQLTGTFQWTNFLFARLETVQPLYCNRIAHRLAINVVKKFRRRRWEETLRKHNVRQEKCLQVYATAQSLDASAWHFS